MIKKKMVKKQVECEEIKDILCDKCGKSIILEIGIEGCEFFLDFPYGSVRDGERYKIYLCDGCGSDFLTSLKTFEEVMG